MDSDKKMTKKEFWIRFGIWALLAIVVPVTYVGISYGLFDAKGEHSLSGWGIIAIIFVSIVLIYIVNQAKAGMPRGTMARQCLDGYCILIPVFFAILLIHVIRNSLADFERFLIITIICEAIAVPINPMPKWGAQNQTDHAENTLFSAFSRAIFNQNQPKK